MTARVVFDRRALAGATVDLLTAAAALGIGRSLAYRLAAEGEFPAPVLRLGSRYRVPTEPLRELLGIAAGRDVR